MRHRINKTRIFQDKLLHDTSTLDERLEVLRKRMESTGLLQKQSELYKETYLHILGRMKHDRVSLELQTQKFEKFLANLNLVIEESSKECREQNQEKKQSETALDEIMTVLLYLLPFPFPPP